MFYWLIPLILGIVLLSVFLVFRVKEKRVTAVIIKGLVSLMFMATAIVAWQTSNNPQSTFGIYVLIAMFFGLLGDVFLDLKYIVLQKEILYTILGFCAFGIGHIFFTIGLFTHFFSFTSSALYIVIPIIITLVLLAITLLMEVFTKIRYQKMKPFVIAYGLCLFFTVSIYGSAMIQNGCNTQFILLAVGFVSFMLSDLILNNTYFAPGFTSPGFIISNHILYYAAQFLIAVSLFYLPL